MIRCQGIPVDAVIKVRDGQGLLIGGYRRTASLRPSIWGAKQGVGGGSQSYILHERGRMRQFISNVFRFHALQDRFGDLS